MLAPSAPTGAEENAPAGPQLFDEEASADVLEFLKEVPILGNLEEEDFQELSTKIRRRKCEANRTIIRQGDTGDTFYIIVKGTAKVLIEPEVKPALGDFVLTTKDLSLRQDGSMPVESGTKALVDKEDQGRGDYPYTIMLVEDGRRGRVMPEEIQVLRTANVDDETGLLTDLVEVAELNEVGGILWRWRSLRRDLNEVAGQGLNEGS